MKGISTIISILSPEERRSFLAQLQQKNKRADVKNIHLFKLLETQKALKNPDIALYGKSAKNAYHALCKRLYDNLIDFVATSSFEGETSEEMEIFKLILASRIFFEHKKHKIAFKTLRKAEQKAIIHDLYSILNEIYHTYIQYAHLPESETLDTLTKKFRANQLLFRQEENLNLAYASIKQQLSTETHTIPDQNIHHIISDTLATYSIVISEALTFKSLFQLLEIGNNMAGIRRDYHTILPFMIAAYEMVLKKEAFNEKHLYYHIEILYLMSNTFFRNKEFKTSLMYLGQLEQQLQLQHQKYYNTFSGRLHLLKALNENYTGNFEKAITILEQYCTTKNYQKSEVQFQINLSRIVYYFQQHRLKEAFRMFREFPHSDQWYIEKVGRDWVVKKNLIEILLHIELGNTDLVDSRLKSFRRKHFDYLKKNGEQRVITFIKLIIIYYNSPEEVTSETFKNKVENSFTWINSQLEDIYVMSFYAWLKAKMEKIDLYQTTLVLTRYSFDDYTRLH